MNDNNHGGKRAGSGRKTRTNEQISIKLGIEAIEQVYGSEKAYWIYFAKLSKESFNHFKLLHENVYGKVKETADVTINSENDNFVSRLLDIPEDNYNKLFNEETNG